MHTHRGVFNYAGLLGHQTSSTNKNDEGVTSPTPGATSKGVSLALAMGISRQPANMHSCVCVHFFALFPYSMHTCKQANGLLYVNFMLVNMYLPK